MGRHSEMSSSVGTLSVRGLPIRFFMYEGRQLDHGYLRHCPGFEHMQHSAYNERLGEVYLRDSLAVHPWRTRSPSEATLFFVPIWEIVSFNVDECNGTSHKQRMAMAAAALLSAPSYRKPRLAKRPPGFDHLIASTGCIENGTRMAERLTTPLFRLLTSSIVGRDRACAIDRWRTLLPCLLCVRMLTRASARASRSALLRSCAQTRPSMRQTLWAAALSSCPTSPIRTAGRRGAYWREPPRQAALARAALERGRGPSATMLPLPRPLGPQDLKAAAAAAAAAAPAMARASASAACTEGGGLGCSCSQALWTCAASRASRSVTLIAPDDLPCMQVLATARSALEEQAR